MGGQRSFVWRDSYPEEFSFPSMPDRPVGRYKEIFEGFNDYFEAEYDWVEQEELPDDFVQNLREKGIYSSQLTQKEERFRDMVRTAASDNWIQKLLDRDAKSYSSTKYMDEHLEAHILAAEGTRKAAEKAIESSENAFHNGGGHHHASRGGSSDIHFNMINDEAVGVEYARDVLDDPTALIVDLDLHFGDGTIAIYRDDPDVYHFSIHEWNNFPGNLSSGDVGYTGSGNAEGTKVNLPLEEGTTGETYLSVLENILPELIDEAEPDILFYQAGADPHHEDYLGGLNLTLEDLYQRDKMVEEFSGVIPIVGMTGGGYSPKASEASINTLAALSGESIVFEEDELTEEEEKEGREAEKTARARFNELTRNSELGFLH